MQARTVIISALVHAGIAVGLMNASEKKHSRAATAVVVSEEKKKPEPKKEQPKPPPPAPPKAPPKAAPAVVASSLPPPPVPSVVPPPSAPRATTSGGPAVSTGLTMSNDGPGLAVPGLGNGPASSGPKTAAAKPAAAAAKPTPPPTPAGEAECTELPTKPEPIFKPDIEYPESARAAGVEGRLVMRVTVAEDGSVSHVDIVSSVEAALDAVAIATVQKWRFKPSMRCNKPVDGGVYTLARRFELGD